VGDEMDDIRRRLSAVEEEQATIRVQARQGQRAAELFASLDRDNADLRTAFHQQRQVLNAIGQTQAEHTAALRQQGEILGGLVIEVARHGQVLQEHTATLGTHTQILTEHTEMLGEQKQMLGEILERLPARD
jgi:hypothetical protein